MRRPLAICKTDGREITVCFQIKGEGTKLLASMGAGTRLHVLMPLGNGFFLRENERKVALVGGGVGIFPMISVIHEYAEKKQISAYMGFRTKAAVCGLEELRKAQRLVAGPLPMLRALKEATKREGIPAFVSLEERMGCGIGACLVCVCDLTNGEHARVCRDGPVFSVEDVKI